jgi:peptidoglycan-associated lipoprotein
MLLIQAWKFAAPLAVALSLAACANNTKQLGLAGAAAPGSALDFVVNVGDRVFFETDQTDLAQQARATLDKQVRWLAQYNRYTFTIEGHADERGTREYNLRSAQGVPKPCEIISLRTA